MVSRKMAAIRGGPAPVSMRGHRTAWPSDILQAQSTGADAVLPRMTAVVLDMRPYPAKDRVRQSDSTAERSSPASAATGPWRHVTLADSAAAPALGGRSCGAPRAKVGHSRPWHMDSAGYTTSAVALPGSGSCSAAQDYLPGSCADSAGLDVAVCWRFSGALAGVAACRLRPRPSAALRCACDVKRLHRMGRADAHSCQSGTAQTARSALDCGLGCDSAAAARPGRRGLGKGRGRTSAAASRDPRTGGTPAVARARKCAGSGPPAPSGRG
jgi:hypothetical protein